MNTRRPTTAVGRDRSLRRRRRVTAGVAVGGASAVGIFGLIASGGTTASTVVTASTEPVALTNVAIVPRSTGAVINDCCEVWWI